MSALVLSTTLLLQVTRLDRGLTSEEAAADAGHKTVTAFRDWVRPGIMLEPMPFERTVATWAVNGRDLDHAMVRKWAGTFEQPERWRREHLP